MKRFAIILFCIVFVLFNSVSAFTQQAKHDASRISLDIKGMDILDVFKILSMRSDMNIIAGKNVRGNVTMFLKDVNVWDAFEIILSANDLAYEKRGDIINVMTQRDYELLYGEKYQDRRQVKTIKIKHARVEDVAAALGQIKTNIGKVVADDPSKSVVIMDVPLKIQEMEKVIENLDTPVITKVYSLKYAKAADVKDKISEILTKNTGSIQIDERTNKIAISDSEGKIAEVDKVMAAFDEKHKEVEIEAMILELTLNDEYQMGINWDVAFQKLSDSLSKALGDHVFGVNFRALGYDILPATSSSKTSSQLGGAYEIGELSTKGFQAVVQFLQKYGKTKILSNPRITVINNEEAKILVGKNQPYVTTTVSQGETTSQTAANVTYIDLGVKLIVTPTINDDGFVTMKVNPEISSSSQDLTYNIDSNTSNTIPIVETSTTETTVMVMNNHTIMLSGLIQKREQEEYNQVPILGDIPFLGNLFKNTQRGSTDEPERKEIIIFLTPRIVYGNEPEITEEVKAERELKKNTEDLRKQQEKKHMQLSKRMQAFEKTNNAGNWTIHMRPEDYYRLVWNRVKKQVDENKPPHHVPGELLITFAINSHGELVNNPTAYPMIDTSPELMEIALKSIKQASPFPVFPSTIDKDEEVFNINISYE